MKAEIYPGILTHTLEEYIARLEMVENSPAEWAHIDFADGQFVPNITVMPHEIMSISTKLKLEAHMMTFRPERYFSDLSVSGVTRVLLHREAYQSFDECSAALKQAADYFSEVGLVINPDTPIEDYHNLTVNSIQCMGVHPGASGQPFEPAGLENARKVGAQKLPVVIAVDGGVGEENILELREAGVSRFVLSSRLFTTNNVSQNVQHFIQLVSGGV